MLKTKTFLLLTFGTLVLGLTLPMMETRAMGLAEVYKTVAGSPTTEQYSVLRKLGVLLRDGKYAVAAIIIVFSIIFPIFKISMMWSGKWPLVSKLGKWSFVDVFVVAVLVVVATVPDELEVSIGLGLYCFAASAFMSMLAPWVYKASGEQLLVSTSKACLTTPSEPPTPKSHAQSSRLSDDFDTSRSSR